MNYHSITSEDYDEDCAEKIPVNCLKKVSSDLRSVELPSRRRCWRKKKRLQRRLLPGRTPSSTWLTSCLQSSPRWEAMATSTTPWRKVSLAFWHTRALLHSTLHFHQIKTLMWSVTRNRQAHSHCMKVLIWVLSLLSYLWFWFPDIETNFFPWLMAEVNNSLQKRYAARELLDSKRIHFNTLN